jgi:hypothetical protein
LAGLTRHYPEEEVVNGKKFHFIDTYVIDMDIKGPTRELLDAILREIHP